MTALFVFLRPLGLRLDVAGRKARKAAITILREHDVKISVIDMGNCKDPDELISKHGVERFNVVIKNRKADMEYIMKDFERDYDLSDHRQVVAYVSDVLEYFRLMKSSVEQDVYINMLSAATKVSANAIYAQLGITKAKGQKAPKSPVTDPLIMQLKKPKNNDALNNAREFLLSLIIFSKSVYTKHKDQVTESLFELDVHKQLLSYIKECYETDGIINTYKVTAHFAEDEQSDAYMRILSLDNMPEDAEKAFSDYMKIISVEMQKNLAKNLMESGGDIEKLNELLKRKDQ